MPPTTRKPDAPDAPTEQPVQTVILQPVQSATWERDQRIRAASARRRDPDAHLEAQMQLDEMRKVLVILEPDDDQRRYGEAHVDKDGYPTYPPFVGTYNGIKYSYPIGVEVELPLVIWEIYADSRRLPRHRTIRTATQGVYSREIADEGAVMVPDLGR